ncbi:MAG: DNA starvation/stationary phase protection protein [Pseudomonadota bacterium]|nr:DNA starvation/stationary phase protection protein [Pseudomonadota bacterium]
MAKASVKNTTAQLVEQLTRVLSDTYVLMVKTHGYHWNVTGPQFAELHLLLEGQYSELFAAADEIAERIRALDATALGSMKGFLENSVVKEATGAPPSAPNMIKGLLKTNEAVRTRIAEASEVASELGDKGSEDTMIIRLKAHDKAMWMLRSYLA